MRGGGGGGFASTELDTPIIPAVVTSGTEENVNVTITDTTSKPTLKPPPTEEAPTSPTKPTTTTSSGGKGETSTPPPTSPRPQKEETMKRFIDFDGDFNENMGSGLDFDGGWD